MRKKLLSYEDKLAWLCLARSNISSASFHTFLQVFGTAENSLAVLPELIKKAASKKTKIYSKKAAAEELSAVKKMGGEIIAACEPSYPQYLQQVFNHPPIITVLGEVSILNNRTIAIVGSRTPSLNSIEFTTKLAIELAEAGFTIVSGFALGIDTAAHKIVQKNSSFSTIAVFASGINVIYPSENRALAKAIVNNRCGALLTELPLNTEPQAQFFPTRNRIIAGLSLGTIVIEANTKHAGSVITARHTLEQKRALFAVPGAPYEKRFSGNNYLLKMGAHLVETAQDVINVINFSNLISDEEMFDTNLEEYITLSKYHTCTTKVQKAKDAILECLDTVPYDIDRLINYLQENTQIVLIALLELEIADKVERQGNKVSLKYIE